jgi:hypothetical protein
VANKFGLVLVMVFALSGCAPPQTGVAPLTPEAKAYVRYLNLSGVQMKSTESYLKQSITEIEGNIENQGDRALVSVEIMCVFYDAYGQVVLRERVPIVKRSGGPLKPGGARAFRLPFDDIPSSWNNQMPSLVIASIMFAR